MKAQFKHAFRAGLNVRGATFAVIAGMMLLFGIFTSTVTPWDAMKITAVALGGCAIGAMAIVNIISDAAIVRRLFATPGAYLYALTPGHRGKTLAATIITMMVLDIVTLAVIITGEVWLSLILTGENVLQIVLEAIRVHATFQSIVYLVWGILAVITAYLLIVTFVMFCVTARRSLFYQRPAGGLMTFFLGFLTLYLIHLLPLLLTPFSTVRRFYMMFEIIINGAAGMFAYLLLNLLVAAGLFAITARLMERKINL